MANEKRLIDANAIPESATAISAEGRLYVAWSEIVKAPTVDAVEVVRCKDCKHYVDSPYEDGDKMCDGWGEWIFPNDDDFCSCGERKTNEATQ